MAQRRLLITKQQPAKTTDLVAEGQQSLGIPCHNRGRAAMVRPHVVGQRCPADLRRPATLRTQGEDCHAPSVPRPALVAAGGACADLHAAPHRAAVPAIPAARGRRARPGRVPGRLRHPRLRRRARAVRGGRADRRPRPGAGRRLSDTEKVVALGQLDAVPRLRRRDQDLPDAGGVPAAERDRGHATPRTSTATTRTTARSRASWPTARTSARTSSSSPTGWPAG